MDVDLNDEVAAWEQPRNAAEVRVDWKFTTPDARIKLKRLYPTLALANKPRTGHYSTTTETSWPWKRSLPGESEKYDSIDTALESLELGPSSRGRLEVF
jgi:hypothetical protein